MDLLKFTDSKYQTKPASISWFNRKFPEFALYSQFIDVVFRGSYLAKRGRYTNEEWCKSSLRCLHGLESIGMIVEIRGIDIIRNLESPCVFIGNHMSSLETVVIPCIIQPIRDITFIVKQSLLDYPVFKHIMRSRDPIAVSRTNPRQDLKTVLEGGVDRLRNGISVVVFPQTTRASSFDPEQFSSIGIKLAKKADVPVVPLALKTDAWGNGKVFKDFGKMDPSKKVRFSFGKPVRIKDRGTEAHEQVIQFIESELNQWKIDDGRD